MAESKIYRFPAELSYARLGDAIVVWLRDRKKMVAEGVSAPNGYLVQAKAPKTWKKFVGMDAATQVQLIPGGDQLVVNIGAGRWADKAAYMGAGLIVFLPLAIPAAAGAVMQGHLPLEIFDFVDRYIVSGGVTSMTVSLTPGLGTSVPCPTCAALNDPDSRFCRGCGAKLALECRQCGAPISHGASFCHNCGAPYSDAPPIEQPWVRGVRELPTAAGDRVVLALDAAPEAESPIEAGHEEDSSAS